VEGKNKTRDWEILRIFLFLALLTLGLVFIFNGIVLTPPEAPITGQGPIPDHIPASR
jgi:hypothetical protein